ncbi:hypothetical protein [Micromonospora sp. KC207]|nr:hypothetical protein [Micromonospora sp. KC207]
MKVVPDGYHTVTPWMISPGNAAELIESSSVSSTPPSYLGWVLAG